LAPTNGEPPRFQEAAFSLSARALGRVWGLIEKIGAPDTI
jgi:hypothetical protein